MLDIISGIAVILTSFVLIMPLVWWLMKDESILLDRVSNLDTQTIVVAPPAPTVEPLIVDVRTVEEPRPHIDELGEWRPWEHNMEQPLLLAQVLMSQPWELDAREIGWVAA